MSLKDLEQRTKLESENKRLSAEVERWKDELAEMAKIRDRLAAEVERVLDKEDEMNICLAANDKLLERLDEHMKLTAIQTTALESERARAEAAEAANAALRERLEGAWEFTKRKESDICDAILVDDLACDDCTAVECDVRELRAILAGEGD